MLCFNIEPAKDLDAKLSKLRKPLLKLGLDVTNNYLTLAKNTIDDQAKKLVECNLATIRPEKEIKNCTVPGKVAKLALKALGADEMVIGTFSAKVQEENQRVKDIPPEQEQVPSTQTTKKRVSNAPVQ